MRGAGGRGREEYRTTVQRVRAGVLGQDASHIPGQGGGGGAGADRGGPGGGARGDGGFIWVAEDSGAGESAGGGSTDSSARGNDDGGTGQATEGREEAG